LHFDDGPKEQAFDPAAVFRPAGEGTDVYVCGSQGYMDYVLGKAKELGVPSSNTHVEYFSADVDVTGESFTVTAARSGIEVTVGTNQTIAEVLAVHGIPVQLSCQEGVCGTCLTNVIEGVPEHRDLYLTDAEKAAGTEMTICCSRAKTNRRVLDI
jgi:ferredoxin